MSKIFLALLVILLLCFSLLACGGEEEETGESQSVTTSEAQKVDDLQDKFEYENLSELEFYPLDDGTYGVSCGNSIYLSEIVIPETYKGKPVSTILENGFENCVKLASVQIPSSITAIGERAFAGCELLKKITMENGVTSIGKYAFEGCTALNEVHITDIKKW